MRRPISVIALALAAALLWVALLSPAASASPHVSGAIFTTLEDGTRVNANIYDSKLDVYLDGGPGPNAPQGAAGLPDGNYYFQVTDPSGKTLLSTDPVICREFRVEDGIIVEYVSDGRTYTKGPKVYNCNEDGKENGLHDTGLDVDHGALTIQLMPYDNTPNKGGVYKAWATPIEQFVGDPNNVDNPCGTGCFHGFVPAFSKTDNFKARRQGGPPFENPILTVRKFLDTDGDGVWDAGEPEIGVTEFVDGGGWPVHVSDPNAVVSDGFTPYQYLPGFAGTYEVSEDVLAGWVQTAAYVDGVPANPVTPSVDVNVAFTSGETHVVIFGNFECFSVTGEKINDLDGDGVRDDGEPGIAGWTISLYRDGELYATTETDENGFYSFEVCAGGEFTVVEEDREGWTHTSASSFGFTASSGVDQTGLDFLNFGHFTVSGCKINDLDGDGVNDGEPTLPGWTIELYRNGVLYASTVTGDDGCYSFTVTEGGDYEVREVIPDGWIATNPESGTHAFTGISDTDQTFDFLNFQLGRICGEKFYDADHDGTRDDGEGTIAGWKIQLYLNGELQSEVFTDENGGYCFEDLGPGTYEVREVMPNNPDANSVWAQTFPSGDGDWDITVTSGLDVGDADFGNVCEFIESRTWGYWKTHTGFDGPDRDPTYDDLPANPLDVDVTTPDGDDLIETDAEANWLFDGGAGEINCSGDCRTLFRAQLLALHMSLLKFDGMADAVFVFGGDAFSGQTVQAVYDAAVAALNDPNYGDFTSFQETLDRINNNHNEPNGSHVLVCADAPTPEY